MYLKSILVLIFTCRCAFAWQGDLDHFNQEENVLHLNQTVAGSTRIYQCFSNIHPYHFTSTLAWDYSPSANNFIEIIWYRYQGEMKDALFKYRIGENGANDPLSFLEYINEEWVEKHRIGEGVLAHATSLAIAIEGAKDSIAIYMKTPQQSLMYSFAYPPIDADSIRIEYVFTYTVSNSKGSSIMDLNYTPWLADTTAPKIQQLWTYPKSIAIEWDKSVSAIRFVDTIFQQQKVLNWETNQQITRIYFNDTIPHDIQTIYLTVRDLKSNEGIIPIELSFKTPQKHHLLFTEVMLKPDAEFNPNAPQQFIEIYNNSNHPQLLSLYHLMVRDQIIPLPKSYLAPQATLVIAKTPMDISGGIFYPFNLPNLLQGGMEASIFYGDVELDYWHATPPKAVNIKSEGGWSLIRQYNGNCIKNTAIYSNSPTGSSPGNIEQQSLQAYSSNPLHQIIQVDTHKFKLNFNHPLSDFEQQAIQLQHIQTAIPTQITQGALHFSIPNITQQIHHLDLQINLQHCGVAISHQEKVQIAQASPAKKNDWIINEILYDALIPNNEFIEIYIAGKACYDAAQYRIALFPSEQIQQFRSFGSKGELWCKGDYKVLIAQNNDLGAEFEPPEYKNLIGMQSFLNLRNTGNTLAIMDRSAGIIDSISYHPKMHHPSYHTTKGISLENTQETIGGNPQNWSSATFTKKGSPGKPNSIQHTVQRFAQEAIVSCSDLMVIHYPNYRQYFELQLNEISPNQQLSAYLFTSSGQKIATLFNQQIVQSNEQLTWNGSCLHTHQIPNPGIYILWISLQDAQGKTQHIKRSLTIN